MLRVWPGLLVLELGRSFLGTATNSERSEKKYNMKAFLSYSWKDSPLVNLVAKRLGRQFCRFDKYNFETGEENALCMNVLFEEALQEFFDFFNHHLLGSAVSVHWPPSRQPIIAKSSQETSFRIKCFYFLDQINTLNRKVQASDEGNLEASHPTTSPMPSRNFTANYYATSGVGGHATQQPQFSSCFSSPSQVKS